MYFPTMKNWLLQTGYDRANFETFDRILVYSDYSISEEILSSFPMYDVNVYRHSVNRD